MTLRLLSLPIYFWILTLSAPSVTTVFADVATFNKSGLAALKRPEAAAFAVATETKFEFRTSHPAGSIWGLYGPSADNTTDIVLHLVLGLTPRHLTAEWLSNGTQSQVTANLTDGRWHSLTVRLSENSSDISVSIDGSEVLRRYLDPSTALVRLFNWTKLTIGGVNGTDGLRGCLANASFAEYLGNSTANYVSIELLNGSAVAPGCIEDPCICANGGRCLPSPQWNQHPGCNCTGSGFGGEFCLLARDFCNASAIGGDPCSGHGFCTSLAALETFSCNCTDGFTGVNCSIAPSTTPMPTSASALSTKSTTTSTSAATSAATTQTQTAGPTTAEQGTPAPQGDTRLVVGLVVGLLLLLLAGTAAGLAFKLVRDRRKDSGVYKPYDREASGGKHGQQNMQDILRPPNEERLI